jgi:hypothetical protein
MSKTIDDLRTALFEALQGVRAGTLDLDKARAINELGKTLAETAKVEVDYLRASGGGESSFIAPATGRQSAGSEEPLPPGITGRTVHRIR